MNDQTTTGLVLGKFYPLHKGHQHLLDFAYHFVDHLFIVVEEIPNETIPVSIRVSWVKTLFPEANVITLSDFNPQKPEEHPEFWDIWKTSLMRHLPTPINCVFAGESYGLTLASCLGAKFIDVGGRDYHRISGTEIRKNPYAHWHMMTAPVKSFFRKKICICGPESTGKSTLSEKLANYYDRRFDSNSLVIEFARTYLNDLNRDLCREDFFNIAKGQSAFETMLFSQSGPLQIIDTGVNATAIWHRFLMDTADTDLDQFCDQFHYDYYLLCLPDIPWVKDPVRYIAGQSPAFFQVLEAYLKKRQANYSIISGTWDERWETALKQCESQLTR